MSVAWASWEQRDSCIDIHCIHTYIITLYLHIYICIIYMGLACNIYRHEKRLFSDRRISPTRIRAAFASGSPTKKGHGVVSELRRTVARSKASPPRSTYSMLYTYYIIYYISYYICYLILCCILAQSVRLLAFNQKSSTANRLTSCLAPLLSPDFRGPRP